MTFPAQRPLLTLLTMLLTVACGGGGKTSDSDGSSSGASASTGAATSESTGQPATSSAGSTGGSGSGSDSASTGAPGSTGDTTTVGTTTVGTTTVGTTTVGTTTAGTTTDSGGDSSGGDLCVPQQGSCANGELCCEGLECCAGIPVPPGKEFCSNMCPISDRNLKTEFAAIDPAEVLRRVVALPLSTWRYRKDEPQVRHLGPMAQDFHAAFGLWDSDTMIFPLDASGVSMAAIQGLHARLLAAEAENEDLRARLDRLEQRLAP